MGRSEPIRVYISCDMEGVAGIADWRQVSPGEEWNLGQELMLEEVNAAIDGAIAAGADGILVNDSHGGMRNLAPHRLHGEADYLSGQHKPLYMMEGLDSSFGACFFIGYHGASDGPPSALSHTYNPAAVMGVSLGGRLVGESGINALVARHFQVPVALVSGDQHTAAQAAPILPGAELVEVKQSVSRFGARSLHPEVARRQIRDAAQSALERLGEIPEPALAPPWRLQVRLRHADLTQLAAQVRGVEPLSELEVEVSADDPLTAYRRFVAVLQITRLLAQEH
ncbi:MAG: M55 family metallopeptidase [Candidatus Dormibacteria bacterium]